MFSKYLFGPFVDFLLCDLFLEGRESLLFVLGELSLIVPQIEEITGRLNHVLLTRNDRFQIDDLSVQLLFLLYFFLELCEEIFELFAHVFQLFFVGVPTLG